MKRIAATILSVILSAQLSSAQVCDDPANIYTFKYLGKKYEIVKEKKSWADAATCAVARGGYLVHINNKTEQDSIYYAITGGAGISNTYTVVNDGGGIAYVWVGATDKKNEGAWLWDGNNDNTGNNFWNGQGGAGTGGGSVVSGAFANWGGTSLNAVKEPDDYMSDQDAAGIALANWPYGKPGEWNDINITNTLYYVIEYDSSSSTGFNQMSVPFEQVSIYPNPSNQLLKINSGNKDQITSVSVINQIGATVHKEFAVDKEEVALDIKGFETGVYLLNIEFASGAILTKKVILNR